MPTATNSINTDLNQLIHAIYRGVLEDEPWAGAMALLNDLFDSELAVLSVMSASGDRQLLQRSASRQPETAEASSHWIALDPFQSIEADRVLTLDELQPEQPVVESPYYRDLIEPSGVRYLLAINIFVAGTPDLQVKIRLARGEAGGQFSPQQREMLASLVQHWKLALHFLDQMAIRQIERNAFADAMNQFMIGTLILDKEGKIVASNRVARDTLEQYRQLQRRDNKLSLQDRKANGQLYRALASIAEGHGDDSPLPRTISVQLGLSDNGTPQALGLMIRPVRPEDSAAYPVHSHAVLFISDPLGRQHISSETLQELFGLTEGESRVAAQLANGFTLNEAADELSISVNTAKSHARSIYEKTGVNKQTKFIQLVANSVARVS